MLKGIENQLTLVEVPKVIATGSLEGWDYLIMNELKGTLLADLWDQFSSDEQTQFSTDLGSLIQEFHSIPTHHFSKLNTNWREFITNQFQNMKDNQKKSKLPQELFDSLDHYVDESHIQYDPDHSLLTGEFTPFNLLFNKVEGKWRLTGLIDFADCFLGDPEYDLLGPILFIFNGNKELTTSFLKSYGYTDNELNESFRKKLMIYTILHLSLIHI